MGRIVAIGGGEIGRPGYSVETAFIDKVIISLANKKRPKLLFIPTASKDSKGYVDIVKKHFGDDLGCKVDILLLVNQKQNMKKVKEQILSSDIIYVGGGNTYYMMRMWRKYGIDELLLEAYDKNIVLSGLSAGSICWFKYGHSDSRKSNDQNAPYIKVSGLGIIPVLHCPHFDVETKRKTDIKQFMKKTGGVCIAIDNCCALEVVDDKYKIISSKKTANAYKIYWKSKKYYQELIEKRNDFLPLDYLVIK